MDTVTLADDESLHVQGLSDFCPEDGQYVLLKHLLIHLLTSDLFNIGISGSSHW